MTEMTDSDVIRAAVDEIERRGWYQGNWCELDSEGEPAMNCKLCGWGALSMVVFGQPLPQSTEGYYEQFARCQTALDDACPVIEGINHFPSWQDQKGRTWDEVQTLMLEVAAKLEGF